MNKSNTETLESVWLPTQRKFDFHNDIILRIPQFTTIGRCLASGDGKLDDMYDGKMESAHPQKQSNDKPKTN